MTFGRYSAGFDPFYCPPCPEGMVCNTVCLDPIDGPLFVLGLIAVALLVQAIVAYREAE